MGNSIKAIYSKLAEKMHGFYISVTIVQVYAVYPFLFFLTPRGAAQLVGLSCWPNITTKILAPRKDDLVLIKNASTRTSEVFILISPKKQKKKSRIFNNK